MMMIKTFVAASEIQGLGVFAAEPVPEGAELWVLNPKFDILIHPGEIDNLLPHMLDYVRRYSYPHLEITGVRVIDCDDGKFMNHSERPNTDFRVFDRGYALTDIAAGEEITCNYYEFDPAFTGFCGANRPGNCHPARQAAELPPGVQSRP